MKIAVLNKKYSFEEEKRDVLIGENKAFRGSKKKRRVFRKKMGVVIVENSGFE